MPDHMARTNMGLAVRKLRHRLYNRWTKDRLDNRWTKDRFRYSLDNRGTKDRRTDLRNLRNLGCL